MARCLKFPLSLLLHRLPAVSNPPLSLLHHRWPAVSNAPLSLLHHRWPAVSNSPPLLLHRWPAVSNPPSRCSITDGPLSQIPPLSLLHHRWPAVSNAPSPPSNTKSGIPTNELTAVPSTTISVLSFQDTVLSAFGYLFHVAMKCVLCSQSFLFYKLFTSSDQPFLLPTVEDQLYG